MKSTVTSSTPKHGSHISHLLAVLLLITLVLPSLASCGRVWNWLWSRDNGNRPIPGDDLLQNADGLPEGNYTFDSNVVYPDTNIHYSGKKGHENRRYCVVIDPGHQKTANSGTEPVGPGSSETNMKVSLGTQGVKTQQAEYELNLRVALLLRNELYDRGYSIVMIRETDEVNISNKERAELANYYGELYDGNAIFVRIHANGDEDPSVRGAMACCQTQDNKFTSKYEESRLLSELLLAQFCEATDSRQYKTPVWETDTKTGINWSQIPTTILEMGFLSNEDEDRLMSYDGFREDAAMGIANGVEAYFDSIAGNEDSVESATVRFTEAVTDATVVTESTTGTEAGSDRDTDTDTVAANGSDTDASNGEGDPSEDGASVSPGDDSDAEPLDPAG